MPRLVVRGMKKEELKNISTELLETIENIIERPKNAFTLDLVETTSFFDGNEVSRVYIEIAWKNRPTAVCQQVADAISPLIKNLGYEKVFVYFKDLDLEKEFVF